MTHKKQTSTKSAATKKAASKKVAKTNMQEDKVFNQTGQYVATVTVAEDLRNSVLIVSLLVNLFILTAWITLQVTTQYDYSVSAFIFGR